MSDHASARRALAKEGKRQKWLAHREREDLRWVLHDERGRRVLQGLMEHNLLYDAIPLGSSLTYVAIGRRAVALALRQAVAEIDRSLLPVMEAELAVEPEVVEGEDVAVEGELGPDSP